jgi:hypothetical protein
MSRIDQVIIYVRLVCGGVRVVEVLAATDGVRSGDLSEIVAWFSGDASKTYIQIDGENIFFHPLPYGDFAIGAIGLLSGGVNSFACDLQSFYVRVFVLSPQAFFLHANNPVLIYERLRNSYDISVMPKLTDKLSPLSLLPLRSKCDVEALSKFVVEFGAVAVARFFQSLFDSVCTIFRLSASMPALSILGGVYNLLPLRFRPSFTFSTRLFLSDLNPLQAVGFCGDRRLALNLAKSSGATLFDFMRFSRYPNPPQNVCLNQWSKLILEILLDNDFAFLEYLIEADAETEMKTDNEELDEFIDWQELNDLAIIWQRKRSKKPITRKTESKEITESAEKGLEKSIAAVEMLLAEKK